MVKVCVCLIILYGFGTCVGSILIFWLSSVSWSRVIRNALFIDVNYSVRGNGFGGKKHICTDFSLTSKEKFVSSVFPWSMKSTIANT